MNNILVVEDESAIADTLVHVLESQGFGVQWVSLGQQAIECVASDEFDLVILDVGLPDLNGFEVCKAIRNISELPIMFLTARGEEIDRIVGLEIGGDDYVTKPFSPREVVARVKAILKRVIPKSAVQHVEINEHGLLVAASGCDFSFEKKPLNLTSSEFKLLSHLVNSPHQVFSREQLLRVCGQASDIGYERNIDTHVKSIRAKLRHCHATANLIKTHRGFGYGLDTK